MKQSEGAQLDYITLLSVVSAVAVVILHTNGCFWQFSRERYWFTANIIESVFYFAVPVFFMITGTTLMEFNKRYSISTYFKKRLHKAVLPFVIWSSLGLVFQVTRGQIATSDLSIAFIVNGILNTSFVRIYWFFVPLFVLYLSIPVFCTVQDKMKVFLYILTVGIFCNNLVPFVIQVFSVPIKWNLHIPVAGGYIIYLLLGYILSRNNFEKKTRYMIYGLAVVGLLAHIIGTYTLSMEAGKIIKTYKEYLNIPCVFYSVGVFVFFKQTAPAIMKKVGRLINFLKDYTLAIYLLHWFFLTMLVDAFQIDIHSIVWRIGGAFLIVILCVVITKVVRIVPWCNNLLP